MFAAPVVLVLALLAVLAALSVLAARRVRVLVVFAAEPGADVRGWLAGVRAGCPLRRLAVDRLACMVGEPGDHGDLGWLDQTVGAQPVDDGRPETLLWTVVLAGLLRGDLGRWDVLCVAPVGTPPAVLRRLTRQAARSPGVAWAERGWVGLPTGGSRPATPADRRAFPEGAVAVSTRLAPAIREPTRGGLLGTGLDFRVANYRQLRDLRVRGPALPVDPAEFPGVFVRPAAEVTVGSSGPRALAGVRALLRGGPGRRRPAAG